MSCRLAVAARSARRRTGQRRRRIVEGLARRIERGDAALRQQEAHRASMRLSLLADPASHAPRSPPRGAHQRDLRIVRIEGAAAVALRHGLRRAEVHHVERAERADVGQPRADDGAEAVFGGRRNMPPIIMSQISVVVTSITPDEQAANRPASPSTGRRCRWRGTPGIVIVLELLGDLLHARRRDAEHGQADGGQFSSRAPGRAARFCSIRCVPSPPWHGRRCRAPARERRVEPLHVGNRVHHHDVGRADIGGDIARRHGRDQTFGTPTGSVCIPGVAIAVPPEPPAEMMPATFCCLPTQARNASVMAATAVPRSPEAMPAGPEWGCERDFLRRNVGALVAASGGKIDKARAKPRSLDDVADVAQFLALGIERAGDHDKGIAAGHAAANRR